MDNGQLGDNRRVLDDSAQILFHIHGVFEIRKPRPQQLVIRRLNEPADHLSGCSNVSGNRPGVNAVTSHLIGTASIINHRHGRAVIVHHTISQRHVTHRIKRW